MPHTALLVRTANTIAESQHFLEDKGVDVIPAPVTKIKGIDLEPGQLRALVSGHDILCCLSQNGVQQLSYYQGHLPYKSRVWTIGSATQKAMQSLFQTVKSPQLETSEGLFNEMASEIKPGTRVCLLKGVGGREFLIRALSESGAIITQINLYQRLVDEKALQKVSRILAFQSPSVMMVASGELLEAINEVASCSIRQGPIIVPGPRVAELAKKLGFQHVIKADGASIGAFYQALQQLPK